MNADTEGERRVLECSVAGEAADLKGLPDDQRRVRGAFIAALLWREALDASGAPVAVHRRGLKVSHARIDGAVDIHDLGAIDGPAPQVSLRHCTAWGGDEGFRLIAHGASLVRLDLSHSRLSAVAAGGLRTVGDAVFVRATISGEVDITASVIGGSLVLAGASLTAHDGGHALSADGADIKGGVFLRPADGHRFEAKGAIRLLDATIGGNLEASGASLTAHDGGDALSADRADIKGSVFLEPAGGHRFDAKGAIRLLGAIIGGQFSANGASLTAHHGGDALWVDGADIKGGVFLRLEGGHRFQAKGAIRLRGATIGGVLDASGASLTAHDDGDALSGDGVDIKGGVFLRAAGGHRFQAKGAIRLLGATIGGQLSAGGASLTAHDKGHALSADGADIKGDVFLQPAGGHRFEAKGAIRLLGATIGGQLSAGGASLAAHDGGDALWADSADIKGGVFLRPDRDHRFEAKGAIRLLGATIGGQLDASGASLAAHDGGDALSADGADIKGGVFLEPAGGHRFEAKGAISLPGATIGGPFDALGASIENAPGDALYLDFATLRHGLRLGLPGDASRGARIVGSIRLVEAEIEALCCFSGATLSAPGNGVALDLRGARIDAPLELDAACTVPDECAPFSAAGTIDLRQAAIAGDLSLRGARLDSPPNADAPEHRHTALLASGTTIRGSVAFGPPPLLPDREPTACSGRIVFDRAEIAGDLFLADAALRPADADPDRITLSLRKTRIGDRLKVPGLGADATGVIDLSGAHAVVLDDIAKDRAQELGWGANNADEPPYDPHTGALRGVQLRLHGFTYDTLAVPEGNAHASADFWMARRAWLRRQSPRRRPLPMHYTPQPHEQLVKVLRSLGYGSEADLVARDKRAWQLECRVETWWRRLWARFVGLAFGHYYSSVRGIATVAFFIGLGTVGTMWAADRGVLVAPDATPPAAAQVCWPDFAWDSANAWVRAGALAADQFVPVIEFQTGTVCTIREDAPTAWAWTLGRIGYALLGLLIVPMAVLTFTGVLRRD